MKSTIIFSTILLLLFIGMCSSCERIDAGYEGIKVNHYGSKKGVDDVSLVTGRVWYNPILHSVYEFPTYVQTVDYDSFTVNARDGSIFIVDPTISMRVVEGNTPRIFKKYRKDLDDIIRVEMFNHVRDAFRIQFNTYTTDSIVSRREAFEAQVQNQINVVLEREGFYLEQLTSGLQYPASITRAIDEKNKAIQDAMRAENELRLTRAQAEKAIIVAKTEAEANRLKQSTLTSMLIQQQFIEKWDGKTPLYGSAPTFFKNVN